MVVASARGRQWSTAVLVALLLVVGCTKPPPPAPPPKPKYRIAGKVQPESGISFGQGVIALLLENRTATAQLSATRGSITAAPSLNNPWPCKDFQRAVDELQRSAVTSAVLTESDGKFSFPDPVPQGDYFVCVGIPVLHDPGRQLPRDWPKQLEGKIPIKILGRDVTVPTRRGWVLKVTVVNSDRSDITLGHPDFLAWPMVSPSPEQLNAIRNCGTQMEPFQRARDLAENNFKKADKDARESGQPRLVKTATEKEELLQKGKDKLDKAYETLDKALEEIFYSESAHGPPTK